eukprot:gb/GFBE01080636.1/.p1 GENE.gb/GFBE01080636.1/~~gb/GFBE01080636.1/.p1  ORF type:complete len:719 (+),score=165.11 gb/GFBE01080636.1/:1-2157(+)
MGQGLPKAVRPIVLERHAGPLFRAGLAEMNGWRPSMEDSHVVVMQDSWGFFGVFDGHGGGQCSAFVARRLTEELTDKPLPADDAEVKSLMLRIDREFLESGQISGSTGTFAFIQPPATGAADQRLRLRVGNIGDSRVLLGRADGTMVEGPGTDGGLTTDHKPDNEVERERIYRTGGTVESIMGVARVNGDLAVSRAFGDARHKETGGPAQEDHPVSVEPEFTTLSCDASDFLILVCDGISEGNFPNREVVELAAQELKNSEPAQAAAAVCRKALERGSMDNLSCMIVLFGGGESKLGPKHELLPAPFDAPTHAGFRKAYAAMTERAGVSLEAAVEKRYDAAFQERSEAATRRKRGEDGEEVPDGEEGAAAQDASLDALKAELALFGAGPPKSLAAGSAERTAWFRRWLDSNEVEPALDPQNMSRDQLLELMERDPDMLAMAQAQGIVPQSAMRTVRVAVESELRPAMERHAALKWDERLTVVCGATGRVLQDDPSDGTAQVRFRGALSATVWLPLSCLSDEGEDGPSRKVRVEASQDEFRRAIEEHPLLKWQDQMLQLPGQCGIALKDDSSDGTSQVRFPRLRLTAWLPTSLLSDASADGGEGEFLEDDDGEDDEEEDGDDSEDEEPLRAVQVPAVEKVKVAIEAHATLTWEEQLSEHCGQRGEVLKEDESDGTSCVRFASSVVAWLPTSVLEELAAEAEEGSAAGDANGSNKRQRTS